MIAINIYNTPRFNQCQAGQSLTQYLVLMFVLTLGSLTAFGQFGHQSKHQVGQVALEISGKHGSAGSESANTDSSDTGNQSNSSYAGGNTTTANNPTAPTDTTTGSNPVTSPDGGNTSPSVPSNTPSSPVANNPVTNPSTGGTTTTDTNNGDTQGSTDNTPTGQTNLSGQDTGAANNPNEAQCTTTWEDNAYTVGECDGWVCEVTGNFYAKAKVAANTVIDLLKGILQGVGDQLNDLWEVLKDPSVLLDIAEQFIKEPKKTIEGIVEGVVGDAKTVMRCGPKDIGIVIGQNVNPVAVLNILGKLSKSSKLSKYIEDKKYEIECLSFPAGTPIWTPNGQVRIEDILKGSIVNARDENSFVNKPQSVMALHSRTAQGYHRIRTEKGTIEATPEHPFWVQGKGWIEAKDLEWEDPIATIDGDVISYQNDYINESVKVYNFSVDKTPNYFAGVFGAWVHNANNCAKGLIGVEFELYLQKQLPQGKPVGSMKSPTGSRDIDASYVNSKGKEVWVEAKSGKYWENITSTPEGLAKFKSDMGRGKQVADYHGKPYELHSNTPIPDHIKEWLNTKGIKYVEY